MQVTVLVLDGTNTLSFAAAVDPMRAANRHAGRRLFDWQFATTGDAPARLTSGLAIPPLPIRDIPRCDLLLVVASFEVDAQTTPRLLASLRRLAAAPAIVAGIDGGPWLMARAGLLDEHSATTHWEDIESFAQTFPATEIRTDRFVVSGSRMTSGGAAPALEMMLHLIRERHGAALATRVAGSFIYDPGPVAARPQIRTAALPHNAVTARAHALMEATLDAPLPLAQIARRLGLTPRALQLHFADRLGTSPQAHYLALRLAEAERLVTQTTKPLQDIALSCGFNAQTSFARAFRARFGTSARSLRKSAQ